ncbi:MAG: PhnD/SsuA/transferrin family substrate-binding protein [Rhodocyclales bacterium]|nr:PhnD/SsuA/transferrin family substrate-binding protein [Rhodocyclales bacterium]
MNNDDRSQVLLRRRSFLRSALVAAALPLLPARAEQGSLRVGLTPVFLDDQMSFLTRWRTWLERRLQRSVVFFQRGSYREVMDLIRGGKLDFAWICGYPYVRYRNELRLVAVPVWRGRPYYQSYLIVPADDRKTGSLAELRGKVFAYSDPDSNSGFLYPQFRLASLGENPATFFSRSFFTWAHRKVVEAVGVGLADGGAVDGYVWDTLAEFHPDLTKATRVIERSPDFGHTPFVARHDIPAAEMQQLRRALLDMPADPEGAQLLRLLSLDGFVAGQPALFDGIARMAKRVGKV